MFPMDRHKNELQQAEFFLHLVPMVSMLLALQEMLVPNA